MNTWPFVPTCNAEIFLPSQGLELLLVLSNTPLTTTHLMAPSHGATSRNASGAARGGGNHGVLKRRVVQVHGHATLAGTLLAEELERNARAHGRKMP